MKLLSVDAQAFHTWFNKEQQEEIQSWLSKNGVDPSTCREVFIEEEGKCEAAIYDLNEEGKPYLSPCGGGVVVFLYPFWPDEPPPWVRWV